jgi:hypothetical protein
MKHAAALVLGAWLLCAAGLPAQEGGGTPLPATDAFLADVRDNLARSQERQNRYAYKERRTELHTNPFGKLGTGATRVFDVVPAADGKALTRRLIERDGQPVTDGRVRVRDLTDRRERTQTPSGFRDVVATLQFAIKGREIQAGKPVILVTFSARPDAKPRTREGKMARVFAGTIWVDEAAREVTRVEATAIDSLSMGFGLIARLNEGTTVSLTRERVADGIWLPTSIRFSGEGRAMLFIRKVTVNYAIDWYDYRPIS